MGNENFVSMSEMWTYGTENGIIDENEIRAQMEMGERNKYIEAHEDEIWLASDGYFKIRVPGEDGKRKTIKRRNREDLIDAMCAYYKSIETEPTIETVFYEWLQKKLAYGEILKQSADRYEEDFDRFFINNPRFKNFGKRKIKYVTEEDLEDFIKITIASMNLTQKAFAGLKILINGIFKRAKKRHFTSLSITQCMGDMEISDNSFKKVIKTRKLRFT